MPRDGSGVYTKPYPSVVSGTTIESLVYNGTVDDIALQLNGPIPVSSGGTGSNTQIGSANNTGTVSVKGAQTWTDAEKTQGRSNIYAAPLDALAYNGMQVNGSMDVSQETGLGAGTTVDTKYGLDGWALFKSGTAAVTLYGAATGSTFPGLPNALSISVQTAQPSLGANDYVVTQQYIEGYRIARLAWGTANAQPITLCFWSGHVRPGIYTGNIRSGAYDRAYYFTYTHNVANAPQYNTITIPGDTMGTWTTTNGIGLRLCFVAAAGTSQMSPSSGSWSSSSSYLGGPGQINGVAATSDVFRLTGVVVLPGIEAPTAAQSPLIMRPYDQELVTCQRYYWRGAVSVGGFGPTGSPNVAGYLLFPAPMRAAPSVALAVAGTPVNVATLVVDNSTVAGFRIHGTPSSGATNWYADNYTVSADARL